MILRFLKVNSKVKVITGMVAFSALFISLTPAIGSFLLEQTSTQVQGAEINGCPLGDPNELTTDEAIEQLKKCLGSSETAVMIAAVNEESASASESSEKKGLIEKYIQPSAGDATVVVSVSCPNSIGSPCFAGDTSIQDAIDFLDREYATFKSKTIIITPGTYKQRFKTSHGYKSELHIVGFGGAPYLGHAPVRIEAPNDGVKNAAWQFGGWGSVSNISFILNKEPGDTGILVQGTILLELLFNQVSLHGQLVSGAKGLEMSNFAGFITLNDFKNTLSCKNTDINNLASGTYINQKQQAFTEIQIQGGYYMVWGKNVPPGCVTVNIEKSPYGDDGHGVALEFVHVQCEGATTCFRVNGDNSYIEIGPIVWRRSPSGKFMDIVGSGSSSKIYFHDVMRDRGTINSTWGNVTPQGSMTIVGNGAPTMPTFPGWEYKRLDGDANSVLYIGLPQSPQNSTTTLAESVTGAKTNYSWVPVKLTP